MHKKELYNEVEDGFSFFSLFVSILFFLLPPSPIKWKWEKERESSFSHSRLKTKKKKKEVYHRVTDTRWPMIIRDTIKSGFAKPMELNSTRIVARRAIVDMYAPICYQEIKVLPKGLRLLIPPRRISRLVHSSQYVGINAAACQQPPRAIKFSKMRLMYSQLSQNYRLLPAIVILISILRFHILAMHSAYVPSISNEPCLVENLEQLSFLCPPFY